MPLFLQLGLSNSLHVIVRDFCKFVMFNDRMQDSFSKLKASVMAPSQIKPKEQLSYEDLAMQTIVS